MTIPFKYVHYFPAMEKIYSLTLMQLCELHFTFVLAQAFQL